MQRVRIFVLFIGVLVLGVFATVACTSGGTSASNSSAPPAAAADGTQQVTITVGNTMSFEPATISLQAGQPVNLTLRNTGQVQHDFTLSDGVAQPVKISASGGQTASGTFTIDQPGTYTFVCSMPGHAQAGMKGTLNVH